MTKAYDDFMAKKAKAAERRKKRREKGLALGIRSSVKKGDLKAKIVRLLGLLDRKRNGNACRIHGAPCLGTLAYHIVPQQRGDAARFIEENVVWACRRANYGEKMNRSLYRDKHIAIFGKERVERIEAIAKKEAHFSTAELWDIHESVKAKIEA